MNEDVVNWVVGWFASREKIRCEGEQVLEIDYLESGLLTSLEIVELVADLEDHFGVQLSEKDMQDPRFSVIGGIAALIAENRGQSAKVG